MITKLTKEQEKGIIEWREHCLAMGRDTSPINKSVKVNHEEHGIRTVKTNTGISYKDLERVFDYEDMEKRRVID